MAAEEDKKFDAVLGGFLVNDLRVRAGHLHCPDSDVLAAYHERALLPEEMNSWKEHIAGCARCQAILAELEATDSIPLQAAETAAKQGEAVAARAAEPLAAASKGRSAEPVAFPEKARASRSTRVFRWHWLAPAGALAAGLLVWVAWHENQRPQLKAFKSHEETKVAKLEPASPPAPAAEGSAATDTLQSPSSPPTDQVAKLSKDQSGVAGYTSAEKPRARKNLKQLEKLGSGAMATPTKRSEVIDKESGARPEAERDSALTANAAPNQPALDGKAGVAGSMAQTVVVQEQAANAQTQAQQNQLTEQKRGGPSQAGRADQAKKAKSELAADALRAAAAPSAPPPPPLAPTEPSAAPSMTRAFEPVLIAGAFSPHVISAPNKQTLWRAGRAGMIDFSKDGGASWTRQVSNVQAELTAGAAPSDKVCWIVGRAGTILLTTDAGSHWTTVHSPLEEDLGGVRATDVLHATIWNLTHTRVLETSDGGAAWKPAASQ